jgi:hypothetical protein
MCGLRKSKPQPELPERVGILIELRFAASGLLN